MKKWFLPILLGLVSLLVPQLARGQSTVVSATIQDANGQALVGGTYNFSSTAVGQVPIKGTLDNSGAFSGVSIPHTPATALINDYWTVTICPDATFPCATAFIQILGSTASLTSVLSPISAISFNIPAAPSPVTYLRGYTDAEIITTPKGGSYFNVILSQVRTCIALSVSGGTPSTVGPCTAWTSGGGGSGGVGPGTANFLSCFVTPTTVGNCPGGATDTGGVFTIPETTQLGGGATASSVAFPSGPTSGCQTPIAGVNIFCSDGTNNTFDISANGGAYVPLATVSLTNSGAPGQLSAFIAPFMTQGVSLFVVVDAIQGAGIGSAQVAWASGTTYPLCQSVSSSGNYIAVSSGNGATTPGTNKTIWYPLLNGTRPTQYDCAFYIAQSQVTSTVGVDLRVGTGTYPSGIGMNWPTVAGPGNPGVNIIGSGVGVSIIKQQSTLLSGSGGDGLAMVNIPQAGSNFFLPRITIRDVTFDANALAPSIMDLHACQQCDLENIDFLNPSSGADHAVEIGVPSGGFTGWAFELTAHNLNIEYNPSTTGHGHGNNGATFTVTSAGGGTPPTIAVNTGGANYDTTQLTMRLVKAGGLEACTSVGTITPTLVSGAFTAVTTTSTGCTTTGSIWLQIYPQINVLYGFRFSNMSDSHYIDSLVCGGVGANACVYTQNVNAMNSYTKIHPVNTFNGIQANGSEEFHDTQIDSVYNHGIETASAFNILIFTGTQFEWNNNNYQGSSDWDFTNVANAPTSSPAAIFIRDESCGNVPHQGGYAHLVNGGLGGTIDSGFAVPSRVHIDNPVYCNQFQTATAVPANVVGQNFGWSNGVFANVFVWGLGSNTNTIMTLTNQSDTATSPFSLFLNAQTAATSGQNASSPVHGAKGAYWDGSVTQPYGWQVQATFASGTGPLATFAFKKNGTDPAGGHIWTFDGTVGLPTGSTAVTQTVGDNTTAVATDAFVIANAGGGGSSAFSALTSSTNTTAAMVVGTGATLGVSGSGTINATTLNSQNFQSPGPIGGSTPNSVNTTAILNQGHTLCAGASPSINTGTGATVSTNNGSCSFTVNVGTSGLNTIILGFSGTSVNNGWVCDANDRTTTSATVFMTKQTNSTLSTTTATISNITSAGATGTAWTNSDLISLKCSAD